jgi:hypothetical protein
MTSELGRCRVVVLHDSCTGKWLHCNENWELQLSETLTRNEALQDPRCWVKIEATRDYIAIKAAAGGHCHSYVQFSAQNCRKMVFVKKACGVREQLEVLQVNAWKFIHTNPYRTPSASIQGNGADPCSATRVTMAALMWCFGPGCGETVQHQ